MIIAQNSNSLLTIKVQARMSPKMTPANRVRAATPAFSTLASCILIIPLARRQITSKTLMKYSYDGPLSFIKVKKHIWTKMHDEVRNTKKPFVKAQFLFPKRARNNPVTMRSIPLNWVYLLRN
jgi:hypothetical protein